MIKVPRPLEIRSNHLMDPERIQVMFVVECAKAFGAF